MYYAALDEILIRWRNVSHLRCNVSATFRAK
jgi:hypothetical protein